MDAVLRRCKIVFLELAENARFDLSSLLQGGDGLARQAEIRVLAPHLEAPLNLPSTQWQALAAISPQGWVPREDLIAAYGETVVSELWRHGLLIGQDDARESTTRDARLRADHWWPLAAAVHGFSRWRSVDAVAAEEESGLRTHQDFLSKLGPPPPYAHARGDDEGAVLLPGSETSILDDLMLRRTVCRNFAPRALPLPMLAALLQRVFAARGLHTLPAGDTVIKRTSPSGGGLHPLEAYVLAQDVQGLVPGLYHYRCVEHRLAPLPTPREGFAGEALAGQHWFSDAPVLVFLSARFDRHQWKYRQHTKALKVLHLEAGHFCQSWHLAATELGLGSLVTAALNDHVVEQALGINGWDEGVMTALGAGWRAEDGRHFELGLAKTERQR